MRLAAAASRAGAQQLDPLAAVNGEVRLDPALAEDAVRSFLAPHRLTARLTVTEAARERLAEILNANPAALGIRIGVKNGGCAGMSYTMEYAEEAAPYDEVVEDKGVTVLIDPKAVLFLLGTEMDFVQDKLGASFKFTNPNETGRCGCGESFTV